MSTKLYVGNMSYDASEQDLEQLLPSTEKYKARPSSWTATQTAQKGSVLLKWKSAETCQAAIDALNENEWMGRKLVVNIARPRQERPRY
jgi:RNA recognition motif-containing protein